MTQLHRLLVVVLSAARGLSAARVVATAARVVATAARGLSAAGVVGAVIGRVVDDRALAVVLHLLELRVEEEARGAEVAGGTCEESESIYILLHRILLLIEDASALDADREECEVVELHLLALEQELLGALDRVAEHTEDGALRIGAVVTVHVLGESLEVEGFVTCRPGEPQALEIALGLPLIKIITNHTIMMC